MVETSFINDFIDQHGLELAIGIGALIGFIILYKKFRKVDKQPDYIKVFNEKSIEDESLNVISSLDPKWLYRGESKLGKIVGSGTKHWRYTPTKLEAETRAGITGWEGEVTTIVFRQKDFLGTYLFSGKKLLHFRPEDNGKVHGDKLVFDSKTVFTALGDHFITSNSYKEISTVIESEWNKRLFEANVNIMASKMSHIASESPEMAHELTLARLKIQEVLAQKQSKVGGLI